MKDLLEKQNNRNTFVVYKNERYTLGLENDTPYIIIDGKCYIFGCHPYEPCLYITDENVFTTAVHNAFEPFYVLDSFKRGQTITSVTGFEYDAKDFCQMVDYAKFMGDIGIDDAERAFGNRPKQKHLKEPEKQANNVPDFKHEYGSLDLSKYPDDLFYRLIENYPDTVVDYCIVKDKVEFNRYEAHFRALTLTSRKLFIDEIGEVIWQYDVKKASGKEVPASELFAPMNKNGELNYFKAFLKSPYENDYTEKDFDKVNNALFPNGTGELEVYKWTTNWSEYFDDGHEWWGTLCYTVYDKSLDRFVVILASATD